MATYGTTSTPEAGDAGSRPAMVEAMLRLEHAEALDRWVDRLAPAAAALVRDQKVADLLHGRAAGHAAHPVLTDVPIGTWTSAFLLDLIGGRRSRPAARRLIGAGILAAVPTAVTGLAEWAATSDQPSRRVGVVHAAANTVGLVLYTASYRARGRGHHLRGVVLSLAGLGVVGGSGYLGAHLSLARKVATRDPAFAAQVPLPDEVAAGIGTTTGAATGTATGTGTGTASLAQAAGLAPTGTTADDGGTGRHVGGTEDPTAAI
ncbi:DUF2231 domain-containing protein [Cellulomonas aerilata]|uniref:DUF2231 domain-containing protein n=1 Tax=Cellulomonas aerilata TaxID=515326 RepID=A0A512DAJ5_9CELL|nr:DUF2231 domain-containing protein [Cellulomonas aerilata]GEO33502.1 hypothetical protein CAE01nite_12270 [Cellulomonas aerilata]